MKKNKIIIGIGIVIIGFFLIRSYYSMKKNSYKQPSKSIAEPSEQNLNTTNENTPDTKHPVPNFYYNEVDNKIDKEKLERIKEKTAKLYNQLMIFKDKEDFHYYGYDLKYKYSDWAEAVKQLRSASDSDFLFAYGFNVFDLWMLGREYMKSKGQETDYTIWVRKRIEKGLAIKTLK